MLRGALEWTTYRAALNERGAKLGAYAVAAGSLLGRDLEPEGVVDALTEWEAEVERSVSEAETEAATARGRADLIRESIAQLDTAEAVCPTCLRPFAEHEAERATRQHAENLDSLSAAMTDAEERATQQRSVLANLKGILADVRSVPIPVEPSSDEAPDDLDSVRRAHDAARDEVQGLDQDIAMRSAAVKAIQDALAAIQEDQERIERLEELFRLEGLANATAQTLRGTADRIMEQQIEPLVAEIARRWKQTFGKEGLQLSPDGRITRTVGGRVLGFEALSGGERVWALLAITTPTTAPLGLRLGDRRAVQRTEPHRAGLPRLPRSDVLGPLFPRPVRPRLHHRQSGPRAGDQPAVRPRGALYAMGRTQLAAYVYHYRIDDLIERYSTATDFFFFRNRGRAAHPRLRARSPHRARRRLRVEGGLEHRPRRRARRRREPGRHLARHRVRRSSRKDFGTAGLRRRCAPAFVADDDRPGPSEIAAPGATVVDLSGGWRFTAHARAARHRPQSARRRLLREPGSALGLCARPVRRA